MGKWNLPKLERWHPRNNHSWPYRVFKQYDTELHRIIASYISSFKYSYSHLKSDGALFTDKANEHFPNVFNEKLSLKNWSDDFNLFYNWTFLNALMALSSYFENYIASIIKECVESDPGLLFGCSHAVDGIKLLKEGKMIHKEDVEKIIVDCTKGDWNSRISHMKSFFGQVPCVLETGLAKLEKLRKIRNEVGHAFGRDIEHARDYTNVRISPMHVVKPRSFYEYSILIGKVVQQLDLQLVANHIGEFEPLFHYYNLYSQIKDKNKGDKLILLKKHIGHNDITLFSKTDCRKLIMYYEAL